MLFNLIYFMNQYYFEIDFNLASSPSRKFYEYSLNDDGTYKLTSITEIVKIKINFNSTINNNYTYETNFQTHLLILKIVF